MNFLRFFFILLIGVGQSVSIWGQCVFPQIEGKSGSGSDTKIGFVCGTGCDKHFYRASNVTEAMDAVYTETGPTHGFDYHFTSLDVSGTGVTLLKRINFNNCTSTNWTTNTFSAAYQWNDTMIQQNPGGPVVCNQWGWGNTTNGVDWVSDAFGDGDGCAVWAMYGWTTTNYFETNSCGFVSWVTDSSIDIVDFQFRYIQKEHVSGGYAGEYMTSEVVSNAKACAGNQMNAASFGPSSSPTASFALASDNSSAEATMAMWRIRIEGAEEKEKYKVITNWSQDDNGKVKTWTETNDWTAGSELVQYYPSADGKEIDFKSSDTCGYHYSKTLTGAQVVRDDGKPCGCPSGASVRAANFDNSTVLEVNLGSGSTSSSLGSFVIRSTEGTASLSTRGAIAYEGDYDPAQLELVGLADGWAQAITPKFFVNIASNSVTSTTIRIMKLDALEDWNDGTGTYDWDSNSSYLIQQFAIENPDGGSATNRLRVREFNSSFTNEWMYTYTSTNSGWNVTLPDGSGSIDMVATNHASNAQTLIRRYRNASNAIIAQESQLYTNFGWGLSLSQEISGTGSDARTRTITYYTNAPFTPSIGLQPIKTVEEPDGSWRYVTAYTASGQVQTELHGIDSGLTTNTNSALRTEYTYTSQDARDTLVRQPDAARKIEDWWKGTLIRRTYHVYTSTNHYVIECPNPSNAIGNANNLITETRYIEDTVTVTHHVHPDGTIDRQTWMGNTLRVDSGEDDGDGYVANGKRTETQYSSIRTLQSIKVWDITNSTINVLLRESGWTNFDYADRAQQLVEFPSHAYPLTSTMSYDCCGLGSQTDPDGTITSYTYDGNHRPYAVTRWGISNLKSFDSSGRVLKEQRLGSSSGLMTLHSQAYDTTGFVTLQTNALGGITKTVRSKLGSGFDQIVSTNADGGTNIVKYLADGRVDLRFGNTLAPSRFIYGVTNTSYLGSTLTKQYQAEIKLDSSGADTAEWEVSCFDGLGRLTKRILPNGAEYVTEYNAKGQKIRDIDPDGVWTLYRYDSQGELILTAIDVDHDQVVDDFESGSGSDRVTVHLSYYQPEADGNNPRGVDLRVDEQWIWTTASSSATGLVSRTETATDGLVSWRSAFRDQSTPLTTKTETGYSTGGARYVTNTSPASVKVITAYSYGRPITVTEKDSSNAQITKTDISYDQHGRRLQTVDARTGATTFAYADSDQVASVTTPLPGTGQPAQTTTTSYDASLRAWKVTQPDGTSVTNEFFPTGALKKSYGSRTYPVEYTYDMQGRTKTMKTWQDFVGNAGTATTTWNYDASRGFLQNKRYNDSTGPDYVYTAGGRLHSRTWARTGTGGNRIVTTYTNSLSSGSWHGDLGGVLYTYDPQSAPNVTYTYDRRGRRASMSSSADAITFGYYDTGTEGTNSHGSGVLNGYNVTWGYNGSMQMTSIGANTPTAVSQSFTYDNAGRLSVATDSPYSATYSYASNSKLISQILYKENSSTRLTTTKSWDYLNRLIDTKATPSGTGELPSQFKYAYNNANQRINLTMSDGSYWVYQYDKLGQVISGDRFWADGTPVAGQQYDYRFDDIGNRTSSQFGGDATGKNLQRVDYVANALNQFTQRTNPAVASVIGIGTAAATVTVNNAAPYRRGEYFWKELAVTNAPASVWLPVTTVAVNGASSTTVTGNQYVNKATEVFSHDADGNLTGDGRWTYSWNAENRLVAMVAATANGPQQKLVFTYDPMGRRIRKQVWNNTAGTGTAATDIKFLYEGWNLVAELDGLNSNTNIRSYLWGTDMSGSRRGAGGVGGAIGIRATSAIINFCVFDGSGNVRRLVAGDSGTTTANYEYGPSGEVIRESGLYSASNPLKYSTKFQDRETEFLYYGHRYYTPSTGRWLSRDPVNESGFKVGNRRRQRFQQEEEKNLYGFVGNNSITQIDQLGLAISPGTQFKCDIPRFDCKGWSEKDKSWLAGLPNCPCSLSGGNPDPNVWKDPSPPDQKYHPGASQCMRSKPTKDGGPGQQCCYDASGSLITGGAGAGTPDKVAPEGPLDIGRHYDEDVAPFFACSLADYLKGRPPNNGNNCAENVK